MARLLTLALTLMTLHFGAASAIQQEAKATYQFAHSNLNSLSNQVTSDIVNLHTALQGGSGAGS
jgi:hypothetical protein